MQLQFTVLIIESHTQVFYRESELLPISSQFPFGYFCFNLELFLKLFPPLTPHARFTVPREKAFPFRYSVSTN